MRKFKDNWFTVVAMLFAVMITLASIMSIKVVKVGGLQFASGAILALFAYQLLDVVNELKGKAEAKAVVWSGVAVKLFAFAIVIPLIVALPAAIPLKAKAFNELMTFGLRVFLAGEAMNLIQNLLLDIPIFDRLKKVKWNFFFRSNLSNIISWTIGSVLFIFLAYYGTALFSPKLIIGQILVRYPLTIIYTAITALAVKYLRK